MHTKNAPMNTEKPTDTLKGSVERIVYQNQESGFVIFRLQHTPTHITTATGHVPTLNVGQQVVLSGSWTTHPKFGKQFLITECIQQVPTSIVGLKKYLGSGMIKGIGPAYAEKLVTAFGENVLDVIEHEPERLTRVEGIGQARMEKITTAWKEQKEVSHIMVFLQEKGVSPIFAAKIYKTYGIHAIETILKNPYQLAEDIWGVGFRGADKVAQNIGIAPDSVRRVTATILHVIAQTTSFGHVYSELEQLKTSVAQTLEFELSKIAPQIKTALHDLYEQEKIKLISKNELHYITSSQLYFSEKGIAQKLQNLQKNPSNCLFDIDTIYTRLRMQENETLRLNDDQQRGIMTTLQNKVSIITGGPGTGKTTLIKALLTILDEHKIVYKLAAPTGRAAKRMSESTKKPAATIHRLLEFDPGTMRFTKNEQAALALDFLIIDEASMIDIFLAHALLKAVAYHTHIVFIGDIDQLPSVGAGNILGDMIASEKIACVKLHEIFRQAQDSMIITNAHKINNGEFPSTQPTGSKRDFIFIKEEDPANVQLHLQDIYKKALPKYGIVPEDSVVLVPMHRGVVGTQQINYNLQQFLNPNEAPFLSAVGTQYKVGDRVMQLRNNYDKNVFNGDSGTIKEVNLEDKELIVQFFDRMVTYEQSELIELALAYAVSIHKSQGSEYSAVIVPLFMQHFMLLQRNLLYTAITRAKKLCIFIGQPRAIALAIKNNKSNERITFLSDYLTSDLASR